MQEYCEFYCHYSAFNIRLMYFHISKFGFYFKVINIMSNSVPNNSQTAIFTQITYAFLYDTNNLKNGYLYLRTGRKLECSA